MYKYNKVLSSSNKVNWYIIYWNQWGRHNREKEPTDISRPKTKGGKGLLEGGALIIGRFNYIYKFPNLLQTSQDGQQYHCKHLLTCSAQLEAFQKVLEKMAEKPEEYIREKGRRTTNPAEGFHGTCLAYRDKRIDLNCQHYECKTNMAILYKVR